MGHVTHVARTHLEKAGECVDVCGGAWRREKER